MFPRQGKCMYVCVYVYMYVCMYIEDIILGFH